LNICVSLYLVVFTVELQMQCGKFYYRVPLLPGGITQGVLDRVFLALQENDVINIQVDHVSLDSTAVKVHPDGTGALKKTVLNLSASPAPDGQPRFTWSPPEPTEP
jgi:hypothetical protein